MSRQQVLPALDCHAHIAPDVSSQQMATLGHAHVFAMTRSLAEAEAVMHRRDPMLTWGVGVHPGVTDSRAAYDPDRFRALLPNFALVGEVGLDRRAAGEDQVRIFTDILDACRNRPVLISILISIHSTGRTAQVVDLIERYRHPGIMLHWFLGTDELRSRALASGAYFSVNEAMADAMFQDLPIERLLPETDFPARQVKALLPGAVASLEQRLALLFGMSTIAVRYQLWANLKTIAIASGAIDTLPDRLADRLLAV
jgi:TatD DNase family protein